MLPHIERKGQGNTHADANISFRSQSRFFETVAETRCRQFLLPRCTGQTRERLEATDSFSFTRNNVIQSLVRFRSWGTRRYQYSA